MMLQLLKKDFLLTGKYVLLAAAICVFYPVFVLWQLEDTLPAQAGTIGFLLMTFFSILFVLLQAFQKEAMYPKSAAFLCALPYSRRDLVLEKYMFFLIIYLGCCLIYRCETLLIPALGSFGFSEASLMCAAVSLILGLYLPVHYRFGYENTKYFFLFAIMITCFCVPMLVKYLPSSWLALPAGPLFPLTLFLISGLFLAVSASLAIHFYQKVDLT